jgi:hypothetical protein
MHPNGAVPQIAIVVWLVSIVAARRRAPASRYNLLPGVAAKVSFYDDSDSHGVWTALLLTTLLATPMLDVAAPEIWESVRFGIIPPDWRDSGSWLPDFSMRGTTMHLEIGKPCARSPTMPTTSI